MGVSAIFFLRFASSAKSGWKVTGFVFMTPSQNDDGIRKHIKHSIYLSFLLRTCAAVWRADIGSVTAATSLQSRHQVRLSDECSGVNILCSRLCEWAHHMLSVSFILSHISMSAVDDVSNSYSSACSWTFGMKVASKKPTVTKMKCQVTRRICDYRR